MTHRLDRFDIDRTPPKPPGVPLPGRCDVYEGWIVAWVDGVWRHCKIASGYVTLADHFRPNDHIGVYLKEEIGEALDGSVATNDLAVNPYLIVGAQVIDDRILDTVAVVRFGRIAEAGVEVQQSVFGAPDDPWFNAQLTIRDNLDLQPEGCGPDKECFPPISAGRHPLPEMPKRWRRSIRSTLYS